MHANLLVFDVVRRTALIPLDGEDEFHDPMAMAFRVRLVIDGCLHILLMLVSGWREGKQVVGESLGKLVSELCL